MNQVACARLLLQHGADANLPSMFGAQPLHVACQCGSDNCMRLLMTVADVDGTDSRGWTPLHIASVNGLLGCARLLVEGGAKTDKDDSTPLGRACSSGRKGCARLLIAHGADVEHVDFVDKAPLVKGHAACARLLVERRATINFANDAGYTPLYMACADGHEACARLLLAHNARDRAVQLPQCCSLDTAQAVGRNAFVQEVTTQSQLSDTHLVSMWASPSLQRVKDAVRTHERPTDLVVDRFVEGEAVHVPDTPDRRVVDRVGEHRVERVKHASERDQVMSHVSFEHMTAVQPGWREADVALADGVSCSCVCALDRHSEGWALRQRVEGFLG